MKKFFIYLALSVSLLIAAARLHAQSVAINTDGSSPHASAILDVKSTTKGVLVPRMTADQRSAIANPAKGLLVFQTDPVPAFCYYNGLAWINLSTSNTLNSEGFSTNYGFTITVAGDTTNFSGPSVDGYGTAARTGLPFGLAANSKGDVYIIEDFRHSVRKINTIGHVTTIAGFSITSGYVDGTGAAARFFRPSGIATDSLDNVYVADRFNSCIRKITPAGIVSTYVGVAGGLPQTIDGDSLSARFKTPFGIAVDRFGNIYVSDSSVHIIRKIDSNKNVTTIGGVQDVFGLVNSVENLGYTLFRGPCGMVTDTAGNLYIADRSNHVIRKITPAGDISTFTGTGVAGNTDGTLATASFHSPMAIAMDKAGNFYIVDEGNHNVRKITPAGMVSTIAGAGFPGYVDGSGAAALFWAPAGIAVDLMGNLYIGDRRNNTIRKIFLH